MNEGVAEMPPTVERKHTTSYDGRGVKRSVQLIQKAPHVVEEVSNASRKSRKKKRFAQIEKEIQETSPATSKKAIVDGELSERRNGPLGTVKVKEEVQEMPEAVDECSSSTSKRRKRKSRLLRFVEIEEQVEETSQAVEASSNESPKRKEKKKKFKPLKIEEALPWHRQFVFNRDDIKRLKETTGIELKRGRFTEEEDALIKKNWNAYSNYYKLDYFDVFCCGHRKSEDAKFTKETHVYAELARKLPLRTACSVAYRARVILHPCYDIQHRYSQSEKERILELKEIHGKDWNKISLFLQRTPYSVAQHYARMLYKKGPFSEEEKNAIFDWIRETYGEERMDTLSSSDIDWKRMQQEVMRHRFPGQLKVAWINWVSKVSLDEANRKKTILRFLDRLQEFDVQKESEVPWSEIAAELSAEERYLRRRFAWWKCFIVPEMKGQPIAADRLRTVRLDDADVIRNGDELDKVDFKSNKAVVLCDMNGKSASTAIEKAAATDDRSRDTDVTSLRVDQEKRLRREIANSNERRRMQSINAGFQMLRSLLPKKGEKMSKAAILQQTADYLQEMDTRNVNLVKQLSKLRKLLEVKGPKEQPTDAPEVNHIGIQVELLLLPNNPVSKSGPPKKRQKVNKSSSLDDRCSSGESSIMEVESAKSEAAVQTDLFDGTAEVDMLKRRLFELQLALDHERQLSYMREEHYCRKLELSHFGSLGHIPTVSMIDFPVGHHHPAMHNVTKGFAAPNSTLKSAQQSFLPVTGCSLNGDLMCPTPPCATSPQAVVFNSTMPPISSLMPHHSQLAAAAAAERPSTIWVPITEAPRTTLGVNPNCDVKTANYPGNKCSNGGQQPKQSLNAIIEAIRQLEGEELFVDSECRRTAKWDQRQGGETASVSSPFNSQQNGNGVTGSVAPTEEQYIQKSVPKIGFDNYGTCETHHREMTVVSS
ncbi:hypothetical protein M513_03100 [Trichuris suis]|uniref:BHLH domain-containing protein n=1 Tax=Trichuris suis TaxID=68888 RepID=A0A085MFI0_9BILA|nr:hypothetical protein M513_03100 [Trichuris suis]